MAFPLITDSDALRDLTSRWKKETIIAVDTEASSFHHYVVRLCLVQVTTTDGTWLVDPLKIDDLTPFTDILTDEKSRSFYMMPISISACFIGSTTAGSTPFSTRVSQRS